MTAVRMAASLPSGRHLALLALVAVIAFIAALPQIMRVPEPRHYYRFNAAEFHVKGKPDRTVSLPARWVHETAFGPETATYRISFVPKDLPDTELALFIPAVRQTIEVRLNGHLLPPMPRSSWSSPRSGYAYAATLPQQFIDAGGHNDLEIRLIRTDGWLSGYLSPVYVSAAKDVKGYRRIADMLTEQWRAMTFALHVVAVMGFVTILLFRYHDPVFQWLTLVTGWSLVLVLSQSPVVGQFLDGSRLYLLPGVAGVGLMAIGVAMALTGRDHPHWLRISVWLVPLALFLFGVSGVVGLPAAIVAGIAMWLYASMSGEANAMMLGVVILVAMLGACTGSGIFGVVVPLTLKRLGADPAMASSIFLTTFTDILGMGLMLFLASSILL